MRSRLIFLVALLPLGAVLMAAEDVPTGAPAAEAAAGTPEPGPAAPDAAPRHEPPRAARIAYVMAGNRVRQGRYKDALRYYMEAIATDPEYVQAMVDAALIYKHLGAYDRGEQMVRRALGVAPASPDLYHVRGELHQARGLEFLEKRRPEHAANEIHAAVKAYGEAIEQAEAKNLLASRAATYFRLGEICYFAHGDVNGARAYWQKVVDLHTPTPEPSEPVTEYRRHTYLKVRLLTWQEWAAAYLRRLEEVEFGPRPQPSPAPGPSGAPRRDEAAPTDPGLAPETVAPPAPGDDPATPAP